MATKVEKKMPNGDTAIFYKLNGLTFKGDMISKLMPAKDLDLQVKWIKETEIRDDDVIICAYPKTGTHWSWEISNMILNGSTEYQKDTKEAVMLEFCTQEMTASVPSPRVLNTHMNHGLIPDGIKDKKCKIIHVMRNPKDVVVSFYFHIKKQSEVTGRADIPPFEMFTKMFRGAFGEPIMCSYLWYIKDWLQFKKDYPDVPLLDVFYEDIKKDPETEIKRIAKFLGKDIDDAMVKEINDKCNFQNMKVAHDKKNDTVFKNISGGTGSGFLYRKGAIGDWKNYLTVAESEEFDKWIESEMKDTDIKFKYE